MTTPPIDAVGWTKNQIAKKFRSIIGAPSSDQMSDETVSAYLNNYLVFGMPHELKTQISNQPLKFKTYPGINVYSFLGSFLTNSPGAYADGFPLIFYEDPDIFYQDWPMQYGVDSVATGDGVTSSFSGNTQGFPLIIGSFFITDGSQILQDDGSGVLTGDGTGTLDYSTGAFLAQFLAPPSSSSTIYCKYQAYSGNRPQGILFFNEKFTLMPVPDQVYQIQMQGFVVPTILVNDYDKPPQEEWGPLIALGAALDVFDDRGDKENYDRYYSSFKRYEAIAIDRTITQYSPMQGVPRF